MLCCYKYVIKCRYKNNSNAYFSTFLEFATECGWDHLYIFDGDSVFSDLLGVLSGMIRQDRYSVKRVPEVVGKSGNMLIHFYSDVAYNLTGFNITFTIGKSWLIVIYLLKSIKYLISMYKY